ncbi:MAG: extracellular solute-binding protein [Candidatus Magasanikbacteria bacterium]|jgi:multiple sugar transport system substrate-binding protein|nr:extracellular solute-binding protein [Candidatus Magasanikbacteria bacterium]
MKRYLVFTLSLLLLFGFGCKGPTAAEVQRTQRVTLDYWTVFGNVSQLRQFASAYSARKPQVQINIRQVRFEEFEDKFVNALADDVAPDIISVHAKDISKYQPRLLEMPRATRVSNVYVKGQYVKETVVEPEINAMPSASNIRQNYVSAVGADVVRNGAIYGLPLAMDSLALYYNKDLLDRAGVATPPATWDEFVDAVKKSTRFNSQDDIVQSGVAMGTATNIDNAPDILATLMMQRKLRVAENGIVSFATGGTRSEEAPALEVLRFYTDFAQQDRDTYTWNNRQENAFDAFVRGRSVFYIGYAFDAGRIRAANPQLNLDVVALPQLDPANPTNIANYWVETVVKKTTEPDYAWDFLRFIGSQENVKTYTAATRQPSPYRLHIAESLEDPLLEPFVVNLLTARNWYQGSNADVAENIFEALIEAHLLPVPDDVDQEDRDASLLNQAARRMQQTM